MISRYTRPEMGRIWEDENRFAKWLDVEMAVCEAMTEEGLIPREAFENIKEKACFSVERILEIEEVTKHDVIVMRFSERTRRALNVINSLICMVFFALITWRIAKYATTLWKTGEITETLRIIYYPFTYGVALGSALLALVCLTKFLRSVLGKEETEE